MLSGLPQARACPWLNGENSETETEFNQEAKKRKRTTHGLNAYKFRRLELFTRFKDADAVFYVSLILVILYSVFQ